MFDDDFMDEMLLNSDLYGLDDDEEVADVDDGENEEDDESKKDLKYRK